MLDKDVSVKINLQIPGLIPRDIPVNVVPEELCEIDKDSMLIFIPKKSLKQKSPISQLKIKLEGIKPIQGVKSKSEAKAPSVKKKATLPKSNLVEGGK